MSELTQRIGIDSIQEIKQGGSYCLVISIPNPTEVSVVFGQVFGQEYAAYQEREISHIQEWFKSKGADVIIIQK